MRDGKDVHFTWLVFHVRSKIKNADFSLKKGLDVNFREMCDRKNVYFT